MSGQLLTLVRTTGWSIRSKLHVRIIDVFQDRNKSYIRHITQINSFNFKALYVDFRYVKCIFKKWNGVSIFFDANFIMWDRLSKSTWKVPDSATWNCRLKPAATRTTARTTCTPRKLSLIHHDSPRILAHCRVGRCPAHVRARKKGHAPDSPHRRAAPVDVRKRSAFCCDCTVASGAGRKPGLPGTGPRTSRLSVSSLSAKLIFIIRRLES